MSDTETQAIEDLTCPFCGWRENSSTEGPHFSIEYPEWPGFCEDEGWALGKYTWCECPKCTYTGPLPHFELPVSNHDTNNCRRQPIGGDPMPQSIPRPSIEELQCPGCGHKDSFRIEVSEFLLIFTDYKERCQDKEEQWGNYSPCICPDCHYQGAVLDFHPSALNKESAHG